MEEGFYSIAFCRPTFTPLSLLHPQHSTEHQEEMLFPEQKDLSKVCECNIPVE